MIPKTQKGGYLVLNLSNKGSVKAIKVHRLIAQTFIPNPDNLETVDHINHDRQDNRVENLRWLSREDNASNHIKTKEGLIAVSNAKSIPVNQYKLDGTFVRTWKSATEASKFLEKTHSCNISKCCRGKLKTAYGFKWQFAENGGI